MAEEEAAEVLAFLAGARAGATPADIDGEAWGEVLADLGRDSARGEGCRGRSARGDLEAFEAFDAVAVAVAVGAGAPARAASTCAPSRGEGSAISDARFSREAIVAGWSVRQEAVPTQTICGRGPILSAAAEPEQK